MFGCRKNGIVELEFNDNVDFNKIYFYIFGLIYVEFMFVSFVVIEVVVVVNIKWYFGIEVVVFEVWFDNFKFVIFEVFIGFMKILVLKDLE